MELKKVHLSLGANLGDKIKNLSEAILLIHSKVGKVEKISSVYETEALGFESTQLFNNCCIEIHTIYNPLDVLHLTQKIEKELGREKKNSKGYESRVIDIDLIFYENKIIQTKELTLPHPHYKERNFVLYPLYEIASNKIDPINQLTIQQLKENCPDLNWINRLKIIISSKNKN